MKAHIIITTAIAGLVANAAVAAPANSVRADAGVSTTADASAGTDTKRYCSVETPTGSRLPRKQCHTRKEWASQGVDITAPNR